LEELAQKWHWEKGDLCYDSNKIVARFLNMTAPELLDQLRLAFDPQMPALPDDFDSTISDESLNELFNVEISSIYTPKFGRTLLTEPEVVQFLVFKVNTWNKNSPHTLQLHRVTGNLVGTTLCRCNQNLSFANQFF
jgi:hypothetical protein